MSKITTPTSQVIIYKRKSNNSSWSGYSQSQQEYNKTIRTYFQFIDEAGTRQQQMRISPKNIEIPNHVDKNQIQPKYENKFNKILQTRIYDDVIK